MDEENGDSFRAVKDRLRKREEKRQKEQEKRRLEKEETKVETEKVSYFQQAFSEQAQEIEDKLQELSSGKINKSLLPTYFYELGSDLAAMEQFIAASTFYVRHYDVRKSTEMIQDFEKRLRELQDKLLPKKKFAFKGIATKKKKAAGEKIEDAVDGVVISESPSKSKVLDYADMGIGHWNRIGEVLTLTQGEVCKESVELTDLQDCTVKVTGTPSTLHMVSLKNCKVLSGPVATSIFVDGCVDCTFVVACQQLRVHSTSRCDLYVHVTSRTIIEDCHDLRFSPYNLKYDDLDKHFEVAGLDPNKNNWTMVEDFNWILADHPSPNWRAMKDCEKIDLG
ncbi:tubulin-specific chaperone C [Bacillus rossius redtenbacheri]|uniref:tubulin-specific chaperone C n=1 Tax=Bacillus rossius redtenbacheri TaxID=93214 RepID=UPI002FDDF432